MPGSWIGVKPGPYASNPQPCCHHWRPPCSVTLILFFHNEDCHPVPLAEAILSLTKDVESGKGHSFSVEAANERKLCALPFSPAGAILGSLGGPDASPLPYLES